MVVASVGVAARKQPYLDLETRAVFGSGQQRGLTSRARDRMQASRDGAPAGAPQATPVADRVPLVQNLAEALDQGFRTHGAALKAVSAAWRRAPIVQPDGRIALPGPPRTSVPKAQRQAAPRQAWRLATAAQVWTLPHQGGPHRPIAQPLGLGRMTVRRSLQAPPGSRLPLRLR
jgi:hypothetical protein